MGYNTMEDQLFKYSTYNDVCDGICRFYGITTLVDMPGIPKGTTFSWAIIDYNTGSLELYAEDYSTLLHRFKLTLNVEPVDIMPDNSNEMAPDIANLTNAGIAQTTAAAAMQNYHDGKFQTIQQIIDEL